MVNQRNILTCLKYLNRVNRRQFSLSDQNKSKVCLVGAGGGIGKKLALLLKLNPLVQELAINDVVETHGLQLDLSHIDTRAKVVNYPSSLLFSAVDRADIVCIAAGMARKPGMSRDDLFMENAKVLAKILDPIATLNTKPRIAIITNPINSTIPFAYKYLTNKMGLEFSADLHTRLFGITTLDGVRANTFYAQYLGKDPREVIVPVIGGHSDTTIVPIFSYSNFPLEDEVAAQELTAKVRAAGTKVVEAYDGKGSATLSMAYAANRFLNALLDAHYGKTPYECAYVRSEAHPQLSYFAQMIYLTHSGVKDIVPFGNVYSRELKMLEEIVPILKKEQQKGESYADELCAISTTSGSSSSGKTKPA